MKSNSTITLAGFAAFMLASLAPTAANASPADKTAAPMSEQYRAYLAQCQAADVCNGTYLIARNGKLIYLAAIGDRGDPARTPLTLTSQFDIGSISKQFTAVAVLQLARQGKFALSDHVATHLPGFPYPDITVAQLLSHTSGMPDVLGHYSALLRSGKATTPLNGSDIVEVLAALKRPAVFAPAAKYEYNNSGYLVLAALVEAKAKRPFADHLDRTFFKPLRMSNTVLRTPETDAKITRRALGFQSSADGSRRPYDQVPLFFVRGAGGIYSTVEDLLRWQNALTGGKVLTAKEWREATTPARLSDGTVAPYGYGMALRQTPSGKTKIGHGGHYRGFKSELAYFPDSGVTVIQLTNNAQDQRMEPNSVAMLQIANGEQPEPVRPNIGRDLYARTMAGPPGAVRSWFAEQQAAKPASYVITESELNSLGYILLKAPDKAPAILVFELTAQAFPRSANAHDSLSEAYEAAGNQAAALVSAKAALALEPDAVPLQQRVKSLSGKTS
jgi:CubicO group peptidase (beta-lactamase class C family)